MREKKIIRNLCDGQQKVVQLTESSEPFVLAICFYTGISHAHLNKRYTFIIIISKLAQVLVNRMEAESIILAFNFLFEH